MITREQLLECSISKFTQFGSKHVTLDEIASSLGISKKTIYTFFNNKEDLVAASVESILSEYRADINGISINYDTDPILWVLSIYKKGFEFLRYFKPSFLFGLKKYYPKASKLIDDFAEELANTIIFNLLLKAQEQGSIKKEVNLKLIVKIYFFRIDNLVFKENNLFESFGEDELFNHLVTYNLKGITSNNYSNSFF
jgi:AcrR family transcriptional regulator